MKSLSLFKYLFLAAIAAVLLPSCDPDPVGPGTGTTAPFVELLAGDNLVGTEGATVAPGASFTVQLNALPGEANLKTLTIYEDGFQLDASRITISTISLANNPQLVTGDDVNGFTWDITLTAQTDASTLTYEFEVTDDNNELSSVSTSISTESSEPASITFNNPTDPIPTNTGSLFALDLNIAANGNTLNTIAIYEDGSLISDVTRLRYNDPAVEFTANPQAFAEADQNGFVGKIYVRAMEGAHNLTVEVEMGNGETISSVIGYESEAIGTPLNGQYTALLLVNSAGPTPEGGLDLDNGTTVSVNDTNADMTDVGIDGDGNWYASVQAANGSSMRSYVTTTETFTFESVITTEALSAAYDNADPVGETGTLEVGDMFFVQANGVTYLLVTREVNFTSGDNLDSYRFDVKF